MEEWYDKYLPPRVEKGKITFSKLGGFIKSFWELLIHSISPHEFPKSPKDELPNIISKNHSEIYAICKDMYTSANDRIDKVEDKAVKLLSFVTVMFALISFLFLNIATTPTKYVLFVAMILLLLAIVISFRCVNVKGRQTVYIPDIYDFSDEKPKENFDLNIFSKKLLAVAIFNQNVADNTVDILKSARNILVLAIILGSFSLVFGATFYKNQPKPTVVKIESNDSENQIKQSLEETNAILKSINEEMIQNEQQNNLANNNMRSEYDKLQQKVNEMEIKLNALHAK